MKVTFDTNTLGKVVEPHLYKKDKEYNAAVKINEALKQSSISGFFSETVGVIESVPKIERLQYLAHKAADAVSLVTNSSSRGRFSSTIQIGGQPDVHPGIKPVLAKIFEKAFALGFKTLPSSRMGTLRPRELEEKKFKIDLPIQSEDQIWVFLQTIADITGEIEKRRCGFYRILAIAKTNKSDLEINDGYWAAGLDRLPSKQFDEAQKAIAEWADGDTVALHLAYKNDVLCTSDKGHGGKSIFSKEHREHFSKKHGLVIQSLSDLAECLG